MPVVIDEIIDKEYPRFDPEQRAKESIQPRAALKLLRSSVNVRAESSAYWLIKYSVLFIFINLLISKQLVIGLFLED